MVHHSTTVHRSWIKNFLFLLLFSSVVISTGCGEKPQNQNFIAKVKDKEITKSELATYFGWTEEQLNAGNGISEEYVAEAAKKWATEEALYQEAKVRHLDQDSTYVNRIATMQRELLTNRLYELSTASIDVDNNELQEEYRSNREEYRTRNDQLELLYVLATDRDQAALVRKNLMDGVDLGEILTKYSQTRGEDLGWVSKEELDPQIATPASTLVPGGTSYPLKYQEKGYIILQCRQRRLAGTVLPLEEVESEVRGHVMLRKRMEREQALRDSVWASYNPRINITSSSPKK
jgi:hypothetical protein